MAEFGPFECYREPEKAAERIAALVKALGQIAEGRGTFSTDRFEHACNTIADMKQIAKDALALVGRANADE